MKNTQLMKKYAIVVVLLLLCLFFSLTTSSFLTVKNLLNVVRQVSIIGIVAVGMTFVLLTGGINLAVGSWLAVTGVVASTLMVNFRLDPILSMLAGVAAVVALGFLTGVLIENFELPSMIATLGMMTAARGLAFIVTGGLPIYSLPEGYVALGQGYLWGIPVPVIFMCVAFLFGWFILEQTSQGRYFYAMGGNHEAARLAGINIRRMTLLTYSISGLLCGIAGVILMFRINSGQPTAGQGMEMDVITATVLGGVSLSGGEGKIFGVLIGCLIIGVLSNGLIIMNVGEYYQMVVKGLVLVLAVGLDKFGQRQSMKASKAAA